MGNLQTETLEMFWRCTVRLTGAHRHLQHEHLVHLVVLVAQVDNDTLNNTVMLRTATGISECLPSAFQFVFCKHCELSVALFFLSARRAGNNGRRVGATALLAQQADFSVFLGVLHLPAWGYWTMGTTKYSFLVVLPPSGPFPILFFQPSS